MLTASLNSRHLDLADFALVDATPDSGAKANGKPKDAVEDGRLFSAAPLPFDLLKVVDGTVDATVDRLVMGRFTLGQAALSAKLRDGLLNIDPLSGVLAKGHLRVAMALDSAAKGTAKVNFQLSDIDVNALAQAFDATDILMGKADVVASLEGQGDSLRAMMASLNGKTNIVMGKGQVKSSYAEMMGADLLRIAAAAGDTGTTTVNCLVGHFDIAKGLAASRDILFDTSQMTVMGEGGISLSDEQYDLTFTPNPKQALVNLSVPWRIEGPLRRPEVAMDELGFAGTLLTAINPLALLVPLVSAGTGGENPCLAALAAPQPAAKAAAQSLKPDSGVSRGIIDSVIPVR